jgi:hypothetical protein
MNERVIDNVQSQLAPSDSLLIYELPKFPSRKMDEILRTIGDPDTFIIIVSPFTEFVEETFIEKMREKAAAIGQKFFAAKPNEVIVDLAPTSDLVKIKMDDAVGFYKNAYRRILGDISPHAEYITCLRKLTEQVGSGVAYVPVQRILDMKEYELAMARKKADDLFIMEQERIKAENNQKAKAEIIHRDIEAREKAIEEELKRRADARKRRQELAAQQRVYREQKRMENVRDERILDAKLAAQENVPIDARPGVTANPVSRPSVKSQPAVPKSKAYKPTELELNKWNNWMEDE